jgi:hypothetical protein
MNSYDDYPVVQVGNLLDNEEWFKAADGSYKIDVSRGNWSSTTPVHPNYIEVELEYMGTSCSIEVSKRLGDVSFKIRMINPQNCYQPRPSRPSTPQRAVNKIRDLFADALPKLEKEAEEEAKEEAERIARKAYITKISDALGVGLKQQTSWDESILTFEMGREYSIEFRPIRELNTPPKDQEYNLRIANGKLGFDELKTFLECFATLPSVAASRLLDGK